VHSAANAVVDRPALNTKAQANSSAVLDRFVERVMGIPLSM